MMENNVTELVKNLTNPLDDVNLKLEHMMAVLDLMENVFSHGEPASLYDGTITAAIYSVQDDIKAAQEIINNL